MRPTYRTEKGSQVSGSPVFGLFFRAAVHISKGQQHHYEAEHHHEGKFEHSIPPVRISDSLMELLYRFCGRGARGFTVFLRSGTE